MIAVDLVEQLHAASLQSEDSDSVADRGPFGIEIVVDKGLRQRTDFKDRGLDMAPLEPAAVRKRHRARQLHRLARKEAEMLSRIVAILRLGEVAARRADHTVAPDHPSARHAQRLRTGEPKRNLAGLGKSKPQLVFIDVRLRCLIFHSGSIEHVPADWTGRSKDQGQLNNLVEKPRTKGSAVLGSASTGDFRGPVRETFEDSSTGTKTIPKL